MARVSRFSMAPLISRAGVSSRLMNAETVAKPHTLEAPFPPPSFANNLDNGGFSCFDDQHQKQSRSPIMTLVNIQPGGLNTRSISTEFSKCNFEMTRTSRAITFDSQTHENL